MDATTDASRTASNMRLPTDPFTWSGSAWVTPPRATRVMKLELNSGISSLKCSVVIATVRVRDPRHLAEAK